MRRFHGDKTAVIVFMVIAFANATPVHAQQLFDAQETDHVVSSPAYSMALEGKAQGVSGTENNGNSDESGKVQSPVPDEKKASRTVIEGDFLVTQAGSVLENLDIHGIVSVRAANVTIKNSIIRGRQFSTNTALINNSRAMPGLKIVDTFIDDASASTFSLGIIGSNFSTKRVKISGVYEGIRVTGGNVAIVDSIVSPQIVSPDTAQKQATRDTSSALRNDSINILKGKNISILRNVLKNPSGSSVTIAQQLGKIVSVRVAGNTLSAGECGIVVSEEKRGALKSVVVENNLFTRNGATPQCGVSAPKSTKLKLKGVNNFDDDTVVKIVKFERVRSGQ